MGLFSQEHIEKQKQILQEVPAYGNASLAFAPMVSELANANHVKSLLDYGAGFGDVSKNLTLEHEVDIRLYDPAVEAHAQRPEPAEMVICLDVLDVVEEKSIDNVLDDLKSLTQKMAFFSINTEDGSGDDSPSKALFHSPEWWLPKLMSRFELHYFSRINRGFVVVLRALDSV